MHNLTPVVKNLLIITVLVFLACQVAPQINPILSGYYFLSPQFQPWQVLTHMFMHAGLAHIFFNMYALYIFGPALEQRFGGKRFLFYYLSCGVGAFILHQGINHIEIQNAINNVSASRFEYLLENAAQFFESESRVTKSEATILEGYFTRMVGASGAVFGILLAFGMLFSNVQLQLLFPPIPLKAKWFVLIYGGIELILALRNAPNDNVAHYAHLGGMLFGYIILKVWQKQGTLN
ncbi:MAG: rhomboid family intramembrane serine protease [Flavobacteriales bacterium]